MKSHPRLVTLLVGAALCSMLLLACGGGDDAETTSFSADSSATMAASVQSEASIERAMAVEESEAFRSQTTVTTQAAAAQPAPAAAAASTSASVAQSAGQSAQVKLADQEQTASDGAAAGEQGDTPLRQQRIVVRTMDINLVVAGAVQASIDRVAALTEGMGGWTVSSQRHDDFSGSIAVRVPAERLDEAVGRLRDLAVEVESESSTSTDVTSEYFDTQSRVRNLRATETALLSLLGQAPNARDALEIRLSLSEVQGELEVLLGRIKLLEETSAFSLVRVYLRVEEADLQVDAGSDRTVNVDQVARFKATFRTPDDASDESAAYHVVWDFGDGTQPVFSNFTAPTTEPGVRVTASVTHVYNDHRDSPHFVAVRISGARGSSPLYGQDTIRVAVLDTAQMPVDAGEDQTAALGRSVRLRAFFMPPEGIDQFTYTWDFGDGTAATGNRAILTEDSDRMVTAVTTHFYESTEESPYIVQITMTGTGEAGIVEGEDKITVTVTELPAIIVSAGDEVRVEEGDEAQLRGTFNRPVGVTNMRYRWDFGDGSEVEEGALDEGNAVETAHRYLHLRNQPYVATLTVTGESEAGGVEASTMVYVYVVEKEGWVVGGYDLLGNAQDAIRLFSIVVRGAVEVGIWLIILSPLWGGAAAAVYLLNRRFAKRTPKPAAAAPASEEGAGSEKDAAS